MEEIAENRRVFYVACTRAMHHLVLIGSMKKRLIEKGSVCLTPADYRGQATILDMLDDIYKFNLNFPTEKEYHSEKGKWPSVFWCQPETRRFKGIKYKTDSFLPGDFGKYHNGIKKVDLTGPIIVPPYYQISFKSLKLFKDCPRKFYCNIILGIGPEDIGDSGVLEEDDSSGVEWIKEDDEIWAYHRMHCFSV